MRKGFFTKTGEFLDHATSLGGYASITATRFLRFATSSSFTLLIDMLLLFILVEYFNIIYYVAAGMSFTVSTSINYFISRNWGFKGTLTGFFKGYGLFLVFSIFGISLTVFLMWVFVDLVGIYYIISRVIVAVIEGTMTFFVNSLFTFKMPEDLALKDGTFNENSGNYLMRR